MTTLQARSLHGCKEALQDCHYNMNPLDFKGSCATIEFQGVVTK